MPAYWVRFSGRGAGCVEAASPEAAREVAAQVTGAVPTTVQPPPYPANPRISKEEGKYGACPSFCYSPEKCAGHTCCQQRLSCVD